jgi:hypothetical protein
VEIQGDESKLDSHTRSIYEIRHSFGRREATTLNAQLSAASRLVEEKTNRIGFKVDPWRFLHRDIHDTCCNECHSDPDISCQARLQGAVGDYSSAENEGLDSSMWRSRPHKSPQGRIV